MNIGSLTVRYSGAVWLLAAIACAGNDQGDVGRSTQALNSIVVPAYANVPSVNSNSQNHFATTATVTVSDPSCGGTGNAFRTVAAWEEEQAWSSDNPVQILVGSECGFNPPDLQNAGYGIPLTTALTGVPPEWPPSDGNMVYAKEPILLADEDPAQSRSVVMLAEVASEPAIPGSTPLPLRAIAIVLSDDGGQTWHDPHLVSTPPVDLPGLDDLAAASSYRTDANSGGYYYLYDTNTNDIFVTWEALNGHRWLQIVSYEQLCDPVSGCAWTLRKAPTDINLDLQPLFSPFGGPSDIFNVSIVAGLVSDVPNTWPFLMLQWPEVNPSDLEPGGRSDLQPTAVNCATGGVIVPHQVWHGAVSYNYGANWQPMPDSHETTDWPSCVGSEVSKGYSGYRNAARSSLTFDKNSYTVLDAVAIPDTADAVAGTQIEVNGFPMLYANIPPASATLVWRSSHGTTQAIQDQFLPVVGADHTWNPAGEGTVTIAFADSIEDPHFANTPSGVYGLTSDQFTLGAPNLKGPDRIWPLPGDPAGLLGVDKSVLVGGSDYDVLGRHNSIGMNTVSFFTFAGDWTHTFTPAPPDPPLPIFYSSIDTASISP